MANRLGTNDPIYDLSRIGGGLNPLPGSPPDASLDATAVGYGSDTNTLTGDVANFYYNDTTKLLSVKINEVWVQETKYLVVDADGRGDYTTLQAALNAIAAAGADAETWTVIYRTPTTENISFAPGAAKTLLAVHIWSPGGVTLTGRVDGDVYGKLHIHNLVISYTSNDALETVTGANGNSLYLYDCVISRSHIAAPENIVIAPAGGTVYLYDCTISQSVSSPYSVFYGAGTIYAFRCKIEAIGAKGIAEANTGASYYFYYSVLSNGTTDYLFNTAGGGNVYLARCQFDTTLGGTYTILDGDVPRYFVSTVAIKSGNYTLTAYDSVVVFTASATATLPASPSIGLTYRIVCRAGTLVIDGNGSDTIKGSLTQTLGPGEDLILTYTASGIWE